MDILPDPLAFEWDRGNRDKNWLKHGVSPEEVEQVFENEEKFFAPDAAYSPGERRFALFGHADGGRLLTVFFTMRSDKVRVVSARPMSRRERRAYEEAKTNPPL